MMVLLTSGDMYEAMLAAMAFFSISHSRNTAEISRITWSVECSAFGISDMHCVGDAKSVKLVFMSVAPSSDFSMQ